MAAAAPWRCPLQGATSLDSEAPAAVPESATAMDQAADSLAQDQAREKMAPAQGPIRMLAVVSPPIPDLAARAPAPTATPSMPGVSVKGGNNIVTLPSFGSGANQSGGPARSHTGHKNTGPDITVVATSRSGGAFDFYGRLKGEKVYTIYIATALPTVMSYADPASAAHGYAEDLTAPQAMRSDLPAGLPKTRLVIECVLDRVRIAAAASRSRARFRGHDQQSAGRAEHLEVQSCAAGRSSPSKSVSSWDSISIPMTSSRASAQTRLLSCPDSRYSTLRFLRACWPTKIRPVVTPSSPSVHRGIPSSRARDGESSGSL